MRTNFTKNGRYALIPFLISLLFFGGPYWAQAQSETQTEPEYIQGWTALEEAEFHFDVLYAIVKCSPESNPMILLNAFNEGGNVKSIGFTLNFTDGKGKTAQHIVEKFDIAFADMQIASCDSDEYKNLKFPVPTGLDPSNLAIEITYNK
ncbi:hypothetical protein [Roseivirga sp. E12]|uniref:hypothetical protein n=1 Tax=Roseivirga sp. E12 TaxID=2819237 RepID=UPI001ABC0250|nr:hypothetical protein [Roseivirga sp. E12]MBO3696888.1 hypothetical protein [Roseivirga sp. E12]